MGLALLTCAVPAAFADSKTISINFTSGQNTNTYDAGVDWYDAADHTGSTVITADSDHDASYQGGGSGVTLNYSAKNSWRYTDSVTDNMLKGYLDDGSGITISLTGLLQQGFLSYDVTIYAASDNPPTNEGVKAFSSKNVNGIDYSSNGSGQAVSNSTEAWGVGKTGSVSNDNSFTVSGLSGDLTIKSNAVVLGATNPDKPRGSIAGIKLTNTYAGAPIESSLNNSADATWTQSLLAGKDWTNGSGYARLTLTGDNTMTVSDGIITDAIIASGSGGDASSLTLNGGSITLNGPAALSAGTGVTLTINSDLTANSVVNIDGAGGHIVIGGQANVSGLSGNGNLSVASGGQITISGTAALASGPSPSVALDKGGKVNIQLGMTWSNVTSGNGQFIVDAGGQTVTVSRGGEGAWENSFAGFTGTIDIRSGTLRLGLGDQAKSNTAASLGSGTVKIASDASLGLGAGNITLTNEMQLADRASIKVIDGSAE